jgi:phage gpG-like protein
MARQQGVTVEIQGLRELRKDFRLLGGTANRELSKELKQALLPIVASAKAATPQRSGRLAASLRPFAAGLKVGVRSGLPYANVVHWGGTIEPRGVPIAFPRTEFITRAVDERDDRIVDDMGDAIEQAARRHGWH